MRIPGSRTIKKIWKQVNRRGIILMYHRVAELPFDPFELSVSPDRFEEHMKIIKKYANPVQMREMGANVERFSFGRKEIVVSFDDGYADNFINARPILERQNVPAIFFVISGAVGKPEEFWWDEIARILLTGKVLPDIFEQTIAGKAYRWKIKSGAEGESLRHVPGTYQGKAELTRGQLYFAVWEIIGQLSFAEKKNVLRQIASWAGQSAEPRTDHLPMTVDQLKVMAQSPFLEIGAHSVNHGLLSRMPAAEQENEIVGSKRELEKIIGRSVDFFSYPHGNYSDETLAIVRGAGFRGACTTAHRPVERGDDPLLLPRFWVLNWGTEQFEKQLKQWLTQV